jgi:large subunit ribosomal protein L27
MAHRKSGGKARALRDSNPQYLGIKINDGQKAHTGAIIVRQRGTKVLPGRNVGLGKDDTLFALAEGVVRFGSTRKTRFDGSTERKKIVHIVTDAVAA